jgi:hypothetical protein
MLRRTVSQKWHTVLSDCDVRLLILTFVSLTAIKWRTRTVRLSCTIRLSKSLRRTRHWFAIFWPPRHFSKLHQLLHYQLIMTYPTVRWTCVINQEQKQGAKGLNEFYVHHSVHRESILKKNSNKMTLLYSFLLFPASRSTCFGRNSHPSLGARLNCIYSTWCL